VVILTERHEIRGAALKREAEIKWLSKSQKLKLKNVRQYLDAQG
jgi:predicted GIY-YIG superfamily endonuclease